MDFDNYDNYEMKDRNEVTAEQEQEREQES